MNCDKKFTRVWRFLHEIDSLHDVDLFPRIKEMKPREVALYSAYLEANGANMYGPGGKLTWLSRMSSCIECSKKILLNSSGLLIEKVLERFVKKWENILLYEVWCEL